MVDGGFETYSSVVSKTRCTTSYNRSTPSMVRLADLKNKKIIVGITGGIAAYKTLSFIRLLVRSGAQVRVIMTRSAKAFITPLSAATLSKNPVLQELTSGEDESAWNNHVELGLWADAMIIAPATANTLSKMVHGHCDNLMIATYLSARCPVLVAPAMDMDMWEHPSTQRNLQQLKQDLVHIIPAKHGELASGLTGTGRMAEPEELLVAIEETVTTPLPVIEKLHVLVTAGPTYEALDPVRFIGNWSSGKMGIAIAEQFYLRGAKVTLVQGPGPLSVRFSGIDTIRVTSANEMHDACQKVWTECQVGVFAAAVADYKPRQYHKEKIAKKESDFILELDRTPDIAAGLGGTKTSQQFIIGFAMETENEINNAQRKLNKKNMDLIVLNSLRDERSGFGTDTNKVTFISKHGHVEAKKLKTKVEVANDIVTYVSNNAPI